MAICNNDALFIPVGELGIFCISHPGPKGFFSGYYTHILRSRWSPNIVFSPEALTPLNSALHGVTGDKGLANEPSSDATLPAAGFELVTL